MKPMAKSTSLNASEAEVQKACLEWLNANGYLASRMPIGGVQHQRGGKKFFKKSPLKGFPDIFFILKDGSGRMGVIEVKGPTGKLSKEQEEWIRTLEANGVLCIVARSLETVIQRIEDYKKEFPWPS